MTFATITTLVCNGSIPSPLDLLATFDNLPLTRNILGIRYKNARRGIGIRSSTSFYNEATAVVLLPEEEKRVNVKMFCNGGFQISGIQCMEQATLAVRILLQEMKGIRGIRQVPTIVHENGMITSICGSILYNERLDRVGSIDVAKDRIRMGGEEVVLGSFDGSPVFMSKAYKFYKRNLYTLRGKWMGYYAFAAENIHRRVPLASAVPLDGIDNGSRATVLCNKWKKRIGMRTFVPNPEWDGIIEMEMGMEIPSSQPFAAIEIPGAEMELKMWTSNINFMTSLHLANERGEIIYRPALFEVLQESGLAAGVYYDPNFYPGVKMSNLVESCGEYHRKSKKCKVCVKVTAIFFKSGKVLVSGCRTIEQVKKTMRMLFRFYKEHGGSFVTTIASRDEEILSESSSSSSSGPISVWNIL